MTETPERLSKRMLEEGQKTVDYFRSLATEQLEIQLYMEGSHWNVCQLLAHFVSTEIGINKLIVNILDGGSGAPEDFDIDRYNEKKVTENRDLSVDELLERFIRQRRTNANLTAGMSLDDLRKKGRHPFLGVVELEDFLKLLYRHNQIHQRDVRRVLSEAR